MLISNYYYLKKSLHNIQIKNLFNYIFAWLNLNSKQIHRRFKNLGTKYLEVMNILKIIL